MTASQPASEQSGDRFAAFEPGWALIGHQSRNEAVGYQFDGQTLRVFRTWRACLFPLLLGVAMVPALWIPLGQLVPRIGRATFGAREWVALCAVIFFEIVGLAMIWQGIMTIRRLEIDFAARQLTATLREIWKTHVSQVALDDLAAVRTGRVRRGKQEKSKPTDCYWLAVVTRSKAELRLLETTDAKVVAEIGDLICQHTSLPAEIGPNETSRW